MIWRDLQFTLCRGTSYTARHNPREHTKTNRTHEDGTDPHEKPTPTRSTPGRHLREAPPITVWVKARSYGTLSAAIGTLYKTLGCCNVPLHCTKKQLDWLIQMGRGHWPYIL